MARYNQAIEEGVHILYRRNLLKTAVEEDGGVGIAAHLLLGPEALGVVIHEEIFTGDDQIKPFIAIDIRQLDAAVGQTWKIGFHLSQNGIARAAGEQIGFHCLVHAELRNRHDRAGGRAAIEVAEATHHKVIVAVVIEIADRHGAATEAIDQSLWCEGEGHGGTSGLDGEAQPGRVQHRLQQGRFGEGTRQVHAAIGIHLDLAAIDQVEGLAIAEHGAGIRTQQHGSVQTPSQRSSAGAGDVDGGSREGAAGQQLDGVEIHRPHPIEPVGLKPTRQAGAGGWGREADLGTTAQTMGGDREAIGGGVHGAGQNRPAALQHSKGRAEVEAVTQPVQTRGSGSVLQEERAADGGGAGPYLLSELVLVNPVFLEARRTGIAIDLKR